jgi:hypothetical protein
VVRVVVRKEQYMSETIVLSRESRAGVALMKIENILHDADMELLGDIVIKVSNVDTYYYRIPGSLPLRGDERPVFVRKETKELGKPHEKWNNMFTDEHAKNGCIVYSRSDAAQVRYYAKRKGYTTTQKKDKATGEIVMTFKTRLTKSFGTEEAA